jgi:hypothetical protein
MMPVFAIEEGLETSVETRHGVARMVAFYGSTPAYRSVLSLHGWDALHIELNRLSKRGEWAAMAELIDEDVVDVFSLRGARSEIAGKLLQRYGGVLDRVSFYEGFEPDAEVVAEVTRRSS